MLRFIAELMYKNVQQPFSFEIIITNLSIAFIGKDGSSTLFYKDPWNIVYNFLLPTNAHLAR